MIARNLALHSNMMYDVQATFGVRVVHGPTTNIEWQFLPEHVQEVVLHQRPDGGGALVGRTTKKST